MKNNHWDGAPNPGFTGSQSCHKHISSCSISVFSLRRDMGKWPSEIQIITIKWNWFSNAFNSLVSDHFDCFYNHSNHERSTMTTCSKSEFSIRRDGKKYWPKKNTQGVKLQALLLLFNIISKGLKNQIRDIPKKTINTELQGVFSFCYTVTENLDSKVIINFFRKSYL